MEIIRVGGGPWKQNCFLIIFSNTAILVDPGGQSLEILEILQNRQIELTAVLNTHGHFDHIGAVQDILDQTDAKFYISAREVPIMNSSNLLRFIFKSREKFRIPKDFIDLDVLPRMTEVGGVSIELLPTPGHTPGGYCFVLANHIFSGDTVLSSMPGTAKLPGGNLEDLRNSLALLQTLPRDLTIHPGHGRDGKLGDALDASVAWLNAQVANHD